MYVRRPPPPVSAKRLCGGNALTGEREMGRDGTSTRRDVPVSCMFRTVRNGFVDSDTRSARHRMCATARAYVCRASFQTTRRGDRLSHSPLSRVRACSLSGRGTSRAERGRRGLALLRERPTVARTPSYRAILPRHVSPAREYLGPARASRRESAAVCPPPLLRLPRTTTGHGRVSRAHERGWRKQSLGT